MQPVERKQRVETVQMILVKEGQLGAMAVLTPHAGSQQTVSAKGLQACATFGVEALSVSRPELGPVRG